MTELKHAVEIQKPLGEVYALAREVERYPEFLPGYTESRIVKRSGDGALLQRAAVLRGKRVQWKSWVSWKENEAIHFTQEEGPLKGMRVTWRFVALSPASTQLTITHRYETPRSFGMSRLVEWIVKPRLNAIATQVIEAFKLACERRWMVPI